MKDLTRPFGSSMGTNKYYQHFTKIVLYTDGIKDMADALKCHWLIDLIASYQITKKFRDIAYQTWKFTAKDSKCVAECFGYSDVAVAEQKIPFTTLPDGEIVVVAVWQDEKTMIIALPVEG